MRKIISNAQVTLDGVSQSSGGPEEDPRYGFTHGGWVQPFWDDALGQPMDEVIAGEPDLLLGRRTYEIFAGYWPNQDNAIADGFNKATKYVATRSLHQLDWKTSHPMGGNVVDEVRRLKGSKGPALHVWGTGELLQTPIAADLVDEYRMLIYPVVLGEGSGSSRTGLHRAALLWSRRDARPRASSSIPTAPQVLSNRVALNGNADGSQQADARSCLSSTRWRSRLMRPELVRAERPDMARCVVSRP